ncbi:MAG: hypothetical protein KBA38_06565 [Negativicutes bacterium]|nr:hypothetical protein [Negativicutes bacterium]
MTLFRTLSLLLVVFLLSTSIAFAEYVGNRNSYKFHESSCHWVDKMNEENKVFFESRPQAIQSGYVPCKVCKP